MILVVGATGFLGSRVCKILDRFEVEYKKTSLSLGVDLKIQSDVENLFNDVKPTIVINCAAYVGGIQYGYRYPADIFRENLLMTLNLLEACKNHKVQKIINPISNCTYPANATYFKENEFWDGPLHESVLSYGFVRKALWVGSWAYKKQFELNSINLIFPNMYGPGDHFDEYRSHAFGALIKKFVDAKIENLESVTVWGSGEPVREWLHVDDAAMAIYHSLNLDIDINPINIGVGKGISISDLANLIKISTKYNGLIKYDLTKPDGALYKTMDNTRCKELFNWIPTTDLKEGIDETVGYYKSIRK